jgi:peptidoglycan/LPS O-acetylase OafA/YrhL
LDAELGCGLGPAPERRPTFPLWIAAHLLLRTAPDYKNPTPAIVASVVTLAGCIVSFAYTLPNISSALRLSRNDLSYGVYLYHMPAVMTLMWLGYRGEPWLWPTVYALTFAAASLSWYAVERPALALKARPSKPEMHATK